jgi:hypothetical protein
MHEPMVRKQIYLSRRQNLLLKRLARQRGLSEAEIIRQALEHIEQSPIPATQDSRRAIEETVAFARSLRQRPELMQGEPYRWNRQELYEEREGRWTRAIAEGE